jgi:DNA-binding MarR family transcriptional regulator
MLYFYQMEESLFDIEVQNTYLESKIVVAFERISESFRALLWREGKELGLSPIQIQLLVFVALHDAQYCKVSYLAQEFQLTKPTISDAVKVLAQKGYIQKNTSNTDTRSYTISLTDNGKEIAHRLSLFSNAILSSLQPLTSEQKKDLWQHLTSMLLLLQKAGLVSLQRMCFNCANYQKKENGHYCHLLQTTLRDEEIRIDCKEHERKE